VIENQVTDHRLACAARCDEVARLNMIIQTQADIAAASGEPERLLAGIVERAQDVAGADGALVEVREGAHLVQRFGSGMATGFIGLRVPVAGSLSGLCYRTGEPLTCADTASDDRVDAALCEQTGVRSMILVPLVGEGEVVGILKVVSRRPQAFSERDVATLRLMGGFIGAALTQARARHEAQSLALKASQLAAIVESSTDAIYRMTPTGIITSWNPWAEKLFGYTAEEAIGREGHMLAPPEQRPWLDGMLARLRRGERVPSYETVRYHRDGSRVPVSIALSPILDTEGEVIGVAVILRDISERVETAAKLQTQAEALAAQNEALQRQQAELQALNADLTRQKAATEAEVRSRTRELAEQRNFLANLLERLPGGVALLDLNLDFQLTNPAYARAFGKRVEDVMGRHVFEVFPGSEAQVEHLLYEVIRTGEPFSAFSFPFTYQDADGPHETFWDFTYFPVRNAWGEVDSVLSLCLEVTPRVALERQVEAHARQIERDKVFLETVLNHLPAGVFIVGPDHRYQWVNDAAAAMAGQSRSAMVGRDLYALAPTAPRPNPRLTQAFATGEHFQAAEVPLQRADGHLGHYDLTYVPIRGDAGEVHAVMIAGVEVTARVESQRLQAAQLEALRQASLIKDEFIAVASHELRTPLTVIRNAATILAKGRAGGLNAEQGAFTDMILRTVSQLSRLVDDLLDLQKFETGALQYQLGEGDLAAMVHEVAKAFAPIAEAKGLTFTVTAPAGPVGWRFDADRLAQVLHNLLSNAAKFTPAGGAIALAVARDGAGWRLSVTDTGIGIAEADHRRIFDKFVQVESSLQREAGGSGLGLAIARRIVEEGHGGTLDVVSRLGEGSRFTVGLPAA
jgi:PAS domain S-box-containing protein